MHTKRFIAFLKISVQFRVGANSRLPNHSFTKFDTKKPFTILYSKHRATAFEKRNTTKNLERQLSKLNK